MKNYGTLELWNRKGKMPKPTYAGARVTADPGTLMEQASWTAESYLLEAITRIDKALGDGYAQAHPELIAGFINAAAADMMGAIIAQAIGDLHDPLSRLSGAVADWVWANDESLKSP